jgi:hypothetical protein
MLDEVLEKKSEHLPVIVFTVLNVRVIVFELHEK